MLGYAKKKLCGAKPGLGRDTCVSLQDKRKVENELKCSLRGFQAISKEWFLIPVNKKEFVSRLLKRVVNRVVMKINS